MEKKMTAVVNNEIDASVIHHVHRVSLALMVLSILSAAYFYFIGFVVLKPVWFLTTRSHLTKYEVLVLTLAWFLVGVLSAAGLSLHKKWARTLAIGVGAIYLVFFPVGTVFGIYALWVLFLQDAMKLFNVI